MRIRAALLSVLLLLPLPMLADSVTTYTYTGSDFTIVTAPFTTGESVTGSFTMPTLADNLVSVPLDVYSWNFTDGIDTFSGSYSIIGVVSTGATGAIDNWYFELGDIGSHSCVVEDYGDQCEWNSVGPFGENRDAGSWTMVSYATPEPSTFALLGTGVLGLAGMARRRLYN